MIRDELAGIVGADNVAELPAGLVVTPSSPSDVAEVIRRWPEVLD